MFEALATQRWPQATEDKYLNERETDLLKFTLEKRGPWYHVNAWGRTSKRGTWRQVWNNRIHISYLRALNEFNDTGAALADWKSLLELA